jgi:tetratricopeptide (TPR) repeat protein
MKPAPSTSIAQPPWVVRPWIDLAVGCGGWSAPLLLIACSQTDTARSVVVFYALALVCNYPHYMATIHRAYARLEDRAAYRLFTHHVTAGLVGVAAAAHLWPSLLPWMFTAYVMWSPWHYAGQNFGLSMMFLRRGGVDVSSDERLWLRTAFVASYVLLLAAFNQGTPRERNVLSLGLSESLASAIQIVAAIFFVAGAMLCFRSLLRRTSFRSLVPALTLLSTQTLWFVLPVLVSRISDVPSPQVSYSTGVLAVMHSAQYLWITQHYARRDSLRHAGGSSWNRRRYWTLLVLGGVALFLPVPWAASLIAQADFTSSALIVASAVNIHHFLLDGVVWKLRDPKVSQALVSGDGESVVARRAAAACASVRSTPRRVAIAAASAGLIALAAVDQVRYFLASQSGDPAALDTARALNPNDSKVHLKLAAAASRSGQRDAAERSLHEAIGANPHDPAARQAMIEWLVQANRLREAYQANTALVDAWPGNVEALVNGGVLAQQLGDLDSAASWWRRALAHADDRRDVHLYLAELLDGADRTGEALSHYQRYLELIVEAGPTTSDARQVALVVIKFADALARTGRSDLATAQYRLAARIARASALSDVEGLALGRLRTRRAP